MSSVGQGVGMLVGGIIGYFVPVVGWALGASIGGAIGGYLDPPRIKGNHPQVDLSVQTATYGAPIGTGSGNYAKYGNLFWVEGNSLRMETGSDGGGKGGGSKPTPDEVYGTFAIGFGEGEIQAFGRIWCNGKLVYDPTSGNLGAKMANGDVAGFMSLYLGSSTQLPDDRIQADMGATHAPAYRGLHYVVFKDWPMADYGNTLMGMQVKVEILRSATVVQYTRPVYVPDGLIPRTNSFDNYGISTYGYYNPRFENGIFSCDRSNITADHTFNYRAAIDLDGDLVSETSCPPETGQFGYIGQVDAGQVLWVPIYAGGYTGAFTVGGNDFKLKTSDIDNTCCGMSVGADGRLYALEVSGGSWFFNVYDGSDLSLVSSNTNSFFHLGNTTISNPCIPGTDVTYCIESDGIHVWIFASAGGNVALWCCTIGGGALSVIHSFDTDLESNRFLGYYGAYTCVAANNGICCGVNSGGGFFVFDRSKTFTRTPVDLADIVTDRCLLSGLLTAGDIDVSALTQTVRGYKVDNVAAIKASLEPLHGAWPFDVVPSGYKIKFKPRGGSSVATIGIGDLGAVAGNSQPSEILTQSREMDTQLPAGVVITYIDVNREYDKGTGPGAWRGSTDAVNVQNLDLPIVLNADEVAGIEETLLYLYWMERTEFKFTLPPIWNHLEAADVVTIEDVDATYELRLVDINYLPDGRLECTARPNNPAVYVWTAKGQEGQSTGQTLDYAGPSFVQLLDIPCLDSSVMDKPGFLSAMSGYYDGWTGGLLFGSEDQGTTWDRLATTRKPGAKLGGVVSPPAAGRTDIVDTANLIIARFSGTSGAPDTVTLQQMYNGANHFALGAHGRWEIIGAATVVDNGNGTITLSNLMRGRFGTEQYVGTHLAGDAIVALNTSDLAFVGMPTSAINVSRKYRAVTNGQAISAAAEQDFAYAATNLECLSPMLIKGAKDASGNLTVIWTRRSRTPVEPFSGRATPLGESSEGYTVEFWDATWSTLKRTITGLASPTASYSAAQQTSDFGAVQKLFYVRVRQVSSVAGTGYAGQAVVGNLELLKVKSLIHFDGLPDLGGNRVLALHCDGSNGSTSFPDIHGNTVTANGNSQISTAQYPSLTGKAASCYLDGNGDYLSVPDSLSFEFGSLNFGFRALIRIANWSPSYGGSYYATILAKDSSTARSFNLQLVGSASSFTTLRFNGFSDNSNFTTVDGSYSFSLNTWYDIEVCRSGNLIYLFVNGTLLNPGGTAFSRTLQDTTNTLKIGGHVYDATFLGYLNGYVSEVEIYKGAALHTANFTPSSIPFSNSIIGISVIDQAQNIVTAVGAVTTVDNTDSFGGRCLQAYQSSGYVSLPVIPLTELYWTIDLWITPDGLPSSGNYSGIFDYGTSVDGTGGLCTVVRTDGVVLCFFAYAVVVETVTTVAVGERVHLFIQRANDRFYIGMKGIVGTNRLVSTTSFVGDKGFRIGYANNTWFDPKNIKIDEWRVYAGEARYPLSGHYQIPTSPFPDL